MMILPITSKKGRGAMPTKESTLTDTEIWCLVNFIQYKAT
jgi:hypothetical protein